MSGKGKGPEIGTGPELSTGHLTPGADWGSGAASPMSPTSLGLKPRYHSDNTVYETARLLNAKAALDRIGEIPLSIAEQDITDVWAGKTEAVKVEATTSGLSINAKSKIAETGVEIPSSTGKVAEETASSLDSASAALYLHHLKTQ